MIPNWDKLKEATLLVITWHDIVEHAGWMTDEIARVKTPAVCKSVGWFIDNEKHFIRISSTIGEDGDKNIMVIPIGVISDVRIIKKETK